MSKENAKLMEKELTEKRKLTSDVKENIGLKVFINLILAIVVMCVFFILNSLFVFKSSNIFKLACKIISIMGVCGTIVLFEIAFRKRKSNYAINGIELLIASILIMFMPHLYYVIAIKYVRALTIVPVFLSIYYIVKCIISYKMMVKKHHDSLSDIKQILETDEKSYLDEDSTKTIKSKKEKAMKEKNNTNNKPKAQSQAQKGKSPNINNNQPTKKTNNQNAKAKNNTNQKSNANNNKNSNQKKSKKNK